MGAPIVLGAHSQLRENVSILNVKIWQKNKSVLSYPLEVPPSDQVFYLINIL